MPIMNRACLAFLWLLVGMCFVVLFVLQSQLSSSVIRTFFHATQLPITVVHPDKSDTSNDDDQFILPGPYNLLEDADAFNNAFYRPTKECTLEFMNYNRLQQDHPCVINYIRRHYLISPPPKGTIRMLDYPEVENPSDGQANRILKLLHNKTNGFFIECGALDGENLSNTIYMERFFNWTGILIEADQDSFQNLVSRKRNAWSLPVCLSVKPYPTKVTFRINYAVGQIVGLGLPEGNWTGRSSNKGRDITIQCFPLYSILLAVNRTEVDYFSLDVEGHELLVLKTIPFDRVDIKSLSVEWTGGEKMDMGKEPIRKYMEDQGFEMATPPDIDMVYFDLFFTRNVTL